MAKETRVGRMTAEMMQEMLMLNVMVRVLRGVVMERVVQEMQETLMWMAKE